MRPLRRRDARIRADGGGAGRGAQSDRGHGGSAQGRAQEVASRKLRQQWGGRRIAITLLAILFPTARRNALFRHTLDLLTLSASLCIKMCILCVSLPLSGGQRGYDRLSQGKPRAVSHAGSWRRAG